MSQFLCQVDELHSAQAQDHWVVVDCRFALSDPQAGINAYLESHIPAASYAHLERDLSGPPSTDHGRHPLPSAEHLSQLFGALGIDNTKQVVVYDDSFGMVAARLWWMLRYLGHQQVRVLDGGWQRWVGAGYPVASGEYLPTPALFTGQPRSDRLVQLAEVVDLPQLIDAREGPRYRGESEPIDAVAGHIPGAENHCWRDNLAADGRFLASDALRAQLERACSATPDGETTHYCGSGVSACHNVLAQLIAGYPEPRLYCGSWSEWCRDSSRQVMMGTEPGR